MKTWIKYSRAEMFSFISAVVRTSLLFLHWINIGANIVVVVVVVVCFRWSIVINVGTFSKIGRIFIWLVFVDRFCQPAQLFSVVSQRWQSVYTNVSRSVRVPDTKTCGGYWLQTSPLFDEVLGRHVHCWTSVLDNQGVVLVLVEHKTCIGISLSVLVFDHSLSARNHIVKLVLHGNHLKWVVPNQPWAQLFLVEVNKPVDECTIDPAVVSVWHRAQ